jgi:hypothetical protein
LTFSVAAMCNKETAGIASLGFWADKDVSVAGATAKKDVPPSPSEDRVAYPWRRLSAGDLKTTGPSPYVLCQEAKVRGKVGDDIRWDVVLEQAEKLPCKLPRADTMEDPKGVNDAASTSAGSESTPVEFESPGSPAGFSLSTGGSEKDDVLSLAPWRRQRFLTESSSGSVSSDDNEPVTFPWRRSNLVETTSQCYPKSLLLQLGQAMRRGSSGDASADDSAMPKTMGEEILSVKCAPWRTTFP